MVDNINESLGHLTRSAWQLRLWLCIEQVEYTGIPMVLAANRYSDNCVHYMRKETRRRCFGEPDTEGYAGNSDQVTSGEPNTQTDSEKHNVWNSQNESINLHAEHLLLIHEKRAHVLVCRFNENAQS